MIHLLYLPQMEEKCYLDSENQASITESAIIAPMIEKDYRVINKFNNKFVLSRTALVLDNKIKHFPMDHALYLQ